MKRVLRIYTGSSRGAAPDSGRPEALASSPAAGQEKRELCVRRCGEIRRELARVGVEVPADVFAQAVAGARPDSWRKVGPDAGVWGELVRSNRPSECPRWELATGVDP